MRHATPDPRRRQGEQGFALILALLSLVLLTFLGLTLATTTSTELQIAANYRWSQAAYYNAEAGVEVGKRYLREVDWRALLPLPRSVADIQGGTLPDPLSNRTGPEGEPSRNFELSECDTIGAIGYGVVLDDPGETFPFQNSSQMLGETLNGTFTLWIRRELAWDPVYSGWKESEEDDRLVLTAEGRAPFQQGGATTVLARQTQAVRYLEVHLLRDEGDAGCDNYSGQESRGPYGTGFDACDPVRGQGILTARDRNQTGTYAQDVNPNAQ